MSKVTLATWTQDEFRKPNQQLHRSKGDYFSLDHFIPSLDLSRLERLPTWDTRINYQSDFQACSAVHYDKANDRFVLIGTETDANPDLVGTTYITHSTFSGSPTVALAGTPTAIGGDHKQNALYAFDTWMIIGSDGDVYQAADYQTAPTNRYGDGDAKALIPVRDDIWLVTTADEILKWNPDTPAFEAFFAPTMPLNSQHVLHFRDYFMFFGSHNDGTMIVYRVDDAEPVDIRQLAVLPSESGMFLPTPGVNDWSVPFTVHEDRVYFSPGAYMTNSPTPNVFDKLPIYVFDGSDVELVQIVDPGVVATVWGLLSWKGRLLLYFFLPSEQHIYLLTGGRFTKILDTEQTLLTDSDLYSAAGELLTMTSGGGNDGVQFLAEPEGSVFVSSWLDMDHPTSVKHLSHISAHISGQDAGTGVKIEYRTELNGTTSSWTTAIGGTANRRHVIAQNLNAQFHLLQVRVTIDKYTELSTANPAACLETLAVTYAWGIP